MGAFYANSDVSHIPRPFWGINYLENTIHTITVVHNDSMEVVLSIDAWVLQSNNIHPSFGKFYTSAILNTLAWGNDNDMKRGFVENEKISTGSPDLPIILLSSIIPAVFFLLCIIRGLIYCRRWIISSSPSRRMQRRKVQSFFGQNLLSSHQNYTANAPQLDRCSSAGRRLGSMNRMATNGAKSPSALTRPQNLLLELGVNEQGSLDSSPPIRPEASTPINTSVELQEDSFRSQATGTNARVGAYSPDKASYESVSYPNSGRRSFPPTVSAPSGHPSVPPPLNGAFSTRYSEDHVPRNTMWREKARDTGESPRPPSFWNSEYFPLQ